MVLPGKSFVVNEGVNRGDALSVADGIALDDTYRVTPQAHSARLTLLRKDKTFVIAEGSEIGAAVAAVQVDSTLSLMGSDGSTQEAIVLVETDAHGGAVQTMLLPFGKLSPQIDYTVVGIDTDEADRKLAQLACVSFTRGTHITLATGAQKRVEDLVCGDKILTRDAGPQEIRWIGKTTARATGRFAPVRIKAGTLNNLNDLIVSPEHRLFIYQREDALGVGRSELLVKAKHLVNGDTITVQDGGFVDYFQILFDEHQIVYAEGIAAESLLVDELTAPVVPDELSQSIRASNDKQGGLPGMDVRKDLLAHPDIAERLRRASTG